MAPSTESVFIPDLSPYHYLPSKAAGFTLIILFTISTLLHAGIALHRRIWWILPTIVLCGILEILGWAARIWSSYEPYEITPFTVQITATVLGPTPFLAAVFIMTGDVIKRMGSIYSRLTPKYYAIIFCSFDVVSLLVQGAGGGIASSAANSNRDPKVGGDIMLAGIIFQLLVISIFALCCVEYFTRYFMRRPLRQAGGESTVDTKRKELTTDLRIMVSGLAFTTLVLFIRAIYRTIELADGWTGRIIRTEIHFIVLDAVMIVVGMYTVNIVHPWWFLYKTSPKKSDSSETVADSVPMSLVR